VSIITARRWRHYVSLEHWYIPTSPDNVTNQKANINKCVVYLAMLLVAQTCNKVILKLYSLPNITLKNYIKKMGMGKTGYTNFWFENLMERDHLGDLQMNGKIFK
jgi:hypothetical protein